MKHIKREKFAQLIAQGYRHAEAFRLAGYIGKYATSPHPPIKRPEVIARVDELVAEAADKAGVDILKVVREIGLLAFANPQDFVDENGNAIPLDRLTRDQAAAICDLTVVESLDPKTGKPTSRRFKYRLHDKRAALETLGKHLGVFAPDTNLNLNVNVNNNDADKDRQELRRIFTRLIDVRKADEAAGIFRDSTGNVITDPERLKIEQDIYALKQQRDGVTPLRLVSPPPKDPIPPPKDPPPVETPSPPVEDKPLSTTQAFYAWSNKPRNPFE